MVDLIDVLTSRALRLDLLAHLLLLIRCRSDCVHRSILAHDPMLLLLL